MTDKSDEPAGKDSSMNECGHGSYLAHATKGTHLSISSEKTPLGRWRTSKAGPLLLLAAIICAWLGNRAVFQSGSEAWDLLADVPMRIAIPWWALAIVLTCLASLFNAKTSDQGPGIELSSRAKVNLGYLVAALPCLALAFSFSSDNQFTILGCIAWIAGTLLTVLAFASGGSLGFSTTRRTIIDSWAAVLRERYAIAVLLIIVAAGACLRLYRLDSIPAEMTSDHVEKILDAQRIVDGARDIFFASNGGREPLHFYLIAVASWFTQGHVSFDNLKIVAAIESVVGVSAMFLLGRCVLPADTRGCNDSVGLIAALFTAVGFWHVVVTRLSLRTMLAPLVVSIALVLIVCLVRTNRRRYAVLLGVALGAGLYCYQSLRVLPLLAAAACLYALLFVCTNTAQRRAVCVNFIAVAAISFSIFIPLGRYAVEHPEEFWRRAQSRIWSSSIAIGDPSSTGSAANTLAFVTHSWNQLVDNIARTFGMFTYRGDIIFVQNIPTYPAFDPVMGAFLIVGTASWAVGAWQRRDKAGLFLTVAPLVLLLPSAIAVAHPGEVPSNTRASAAMPLAYLFAAFGALQVIVALAKIVPRALLVQVVVPAAIAIHSFIWTRAAIIGPYDLAYQKAWTPQREAADLLRKAVRDRSSWENVFILSEPHFFDWRGLVIEAGLRPGSFRNGDIPVSQLPERMFCGSHDNADVALDPARSVLVVYKDTDSAATAQLEAWFPEGRSTQVPTRMSNPRLPPWAFRVFELPPAQDGFARLVTGFCGKKK